MRVSSETVRKTLKKTVHKTRTLGYAIKLTEQLQTTLIKEHTFVHRFAKEKQEAAELVAALLKDLLIPMQEELAERIAFDFTLLEKEK